MADPTYADFAETPIASTVEALQDAGRDIYIAGFGAHRALIVDNDNCQVTVAHVETCNGLGRWECSALHRITFSEVYAKRFPIRP